MSEKQNSATIAHTQLLVAFGAKTFILKRWATNEYAKD